MKAVVLVIDGFGIGAMPDCKLYSDFGANTLQNLIDSYDMHIPTLTSLGLLNIDGVRYDDKASEGAFARLSELSKAKDTTAGHWEIAGVVTKTALPTFPNGFDAELVSKLENIFGKKILCNLPFSGTEVIKKFGEEHIKTGKPIVYTSADSVLQVACHTDIVSLNQLYDWCRQIREICVGKYNVGRIIARPFNGVYPFNRTDDRKDFSISPPEPTLLDTLKSSGYKSVGVGKVEDIFNFQGLTDSYHTHSNAEAMDKTIELVKDNFDGLIFVNLVDTDMKFGHRRDVYGYAQCIEEFDVKLAKLIPYLKKDDVLYITSDHGNDPCLTRHTDHTREYVPLLIFGTEIVPTNLGTIQGFDCIADTIKEQFGIEEHTKSLWQKLTY